MYFSQKEKVGLQTYGCLCHRDWQGGEREAAKRDTDCHMEQLGVTLLVSPFVTFCHLVVP